MPFEIVEALQQEHLAAALCERLSDFRSERGPLQPTTVVVQNAGLGRWLQLRQAARQGISAGLQLPLVRSFIALELEKAGLYDRREALESERMRWRLFEVLTAREFQSWGADAASLLRYLAPGHPKLEQRCWQLAGEVADLYDQYAMYRPDWVLGWLSQDGGGPACAGLPHAGWQVRLLQAVQSNLRLSGPAMEKRILGLALHRFAQGQGQGVERAEPIHIFGVSTFPPAFLIFFKHLSEHCPVTMYHLVCSEAYLGELPKTYRAALRAAAQMNGDWERPAELVDNPLLIYSGQSTARFQSLLLALDFPIGELKIERVGAPGTDLECLQEAVRGNQPVLKHLAADGSLSFHSCHSVIREVQVLQQQLLGLFAADPDLRPESILVLAPEISEYADAIEAVFGQEVPVAGEAHGLKIPYCIADRLAGPDENCWRFVESLLGFLHGRQNFTELAALLDFDPVAQHLGISREEMQDLLTILYDVGIRWGIDGVARAQQGQPNFEAYSWDYGLERLYNGLIFPESGHEALAPYPMNSRMAEVVGALSKMLRRAFQFVRTRQESRSFNAWMERLLGVVKDCVGEGERNDSWLSVLLPALGDVALVATNQLITFETFSEMALAAKKEPSGPSGLLRRGVTFCRMQPVRHIPAKVLCVLGLNEGAYPRQPRRIEFDLIQQQRRLSGGKGSRAPKIREVEFLGDRQLRDEDRQLFLDCLLNARERLYLSYVGQSDTDKKARPPSLLVSELEQFLALPAGAETESARRAILSKIMVLHPLQEWSRENFVHPQPQAGEPPVPLHFELELAGLRSQVAPTPSFLSLEGAEAEPLGAADATIAVKALVGFFKDPAAYYLKNRLQVNLTVLDWETVFEDEESWDGHNRLEAWSFRQRILDDWLSAPGRTAGAVNRARLKAKWEKALLLPPGQAGAAIWTGEVVPVLDYLEQTIGTVSLEKRQSERAVGTTRVFSDDLYVPDGTRLILLNGALKAKGSIRLKDTLEVYLRHICGSGASRVLCLENLTTYDLPAERSEVDATWLGHLVEAWHAGQNQPLAFSMKIAQAYVALVNDSPDFDESDALEAAYRSGWKSDYYKYGDDSAAQQLCFNGDSPAAPGAWWNEDFARNALGIAAPVLQWAADLNEGTRP